MSDNVVKAGIEDVLSSVKRLVSDEGRKVPDLIPGSGARRPGRLVLTDALRINSPAKVEGKAAPLKLEQEYSAEKSARPMLLRACDIVRAGDAANQAGEAAPETPSESPDTTNGPDDLAGSLSAKIEALEAAIARTEDQWEPDGDSDDAYSGTPTKTLDWSSANGFSGEPQAEAANADAEVTAPEDDERAPEPTATFIRDPDVSNSELAQTLDDELDEARAVTMDEEALRDLVADVVRQELQGALGERITRNVRKMVRREIYRALAAQKVD